MGRASRAKQGRAPRLHGAAAEMAATTAAHLTDIGAGYPGCWATLERLRGLARSRDGLAGVAVGPNVRRPRRRRWRSADGGRRPSRRRHRRGLGPRRLPGTGHLPRGPRARRGPGGHRPRWRPARRRALPAAGVVRLHLGHGHRRLCPPRVGRHTPPPRAPVAHERHRRMGVGRRPPRPPDAGRGHRVDARPGQGQRRWDGHLPRHPDDGVAQLVALARPLVAAVLYLCSADADVIDPDRPGAVPRRALAPGEAPSVWAP